MGQEAIDKAVWLPILRALSHFPFETVTDRDAVQGDFSDEQFFQHLAYLDAHGLCQSGCQKSGDGRWSWGGAQITAHGIDHLKEDGGLTVELGIVTVKLDADTIKALICSKID